jgi:polyhydroxyalkanoate synthesis repressor PhaR
MEKKRTIKKYANRKLYDTQQSCYITLDEISELIRAGQDIVVIDNKSKDDITYRTLIQLLSLLETKKAKNGMEESLYRIIRSVEGTFSGYIKELEAKTMPFADLGPAAGDRPSTPMASEESMDQEQTNTSGLSF